ncbi:DUF3231 family protein [Bacillus piscicola]|uniref:DUF3231 family protein n=1 Tax=Bacillus piscicola TaxID=1632684 RepID=UPI001F0987E6
MPSFTSIFKNAANIVESLTDNHKGPLHVGEAMACWTYFSFSSSIIPYFEIGINTTSDPELAKLLQEGLKVVKSHKQELAEFMRKEGVPLSEAPESKPNSNANDIPLGAKFSDNELINTVNLNFVIAADMCAASASQCLRQDAALMFLKFQTEKLSLGLKSKTLMQQNGWLKIPPPYNPPGSPSSE